MTSPQRPVPVTMQRRQRATTTIIGRPESAKRLAERDPCGGSVGPSHHQTGQLGGGLMGLWMLSFGDRGSTIIEAESMIHARLRVAVKGLVRASSFIGGCQIDPEFIP